MIDLKKRYLKIRQEITEYCQKIGRTEPILIAVTKGQPIEKIQALYQLGHRDFGENYVQEWIEKAHFFSKKEQDIRWHFLGHLQTNKISLMIPYLWALHSLDSVKLLEKLLKKWSLVRKDVFRFFIQVNIDREPQKYGFLKEQVSFLFKKTYPTWASCLGWMVIPKLGTESGARESFRKLQVLNKKFSEKTLGKLSMGMSQDYLIAIEEGADFIRIGTALLGPRMKKA